MGAVNRTATPGLFFAVALTLAPSGAADQARHCTINCYLE
jgi:hypothetical protein